MAKPIEPDKFIALINLPPAILKGDVFEATQLSPFYINRLMRKNRIKIIQERGYHIQPVDVKIKKTKTETAPRKRRSSTAVDE